jgi:DNA-binding transcriptional LysR family regulator
MVAIDGSPVDMNLLATLDVLLEERNVTRAARRLSLTQSTVSHALGRLRAMFRDPLLVRAGRGLVATPRAETLGPAVRRVLADARRLIAHEAEFVPQTSTRAFTLVCPDALVAFLPSLLARLTHDAPGVRLEARPPIGIDVDAALGLGSIDLALVAARESGPGLVQRPIGIVHWCIVARRGHPAVKRGKLDRDGWLRHPHVVVGTGGGGAGFVGEALREARLPRRIGFVAPGFLAAPFAVADTDFFFAAPRELVTNVAARLGLQLLDPPVPLPPIKVSMVWHERMHAEAGHRWLRDAVHTAGRALVTA